MYVVNSKLSLMLRVNGHKNKEYQLLRCKVGEFRETMIFYHSLK